MRIATLLSALALVALPAPAAAAAAPCTWQEEHLPVPAGSMLAAVEATDHAGGYSGTAYRSGSGWYVVSWRNGAVTEHGTVTPTTTLRVIDQNRAGTIVVNSEYGQWGQVKRAFRIHGGQWSELPVPAGGSQAIAVAINDTGDVLGTVRTQRDGQSGPVVVRWPADRPTVVEQLANVPVHSEAIGLDEDGTALVGVRASAGAAAVPHLWRAGVLTDLPALPGTNTARARDISNGRVTGGVSTRNGPNQGVYWDRDRVPRALPGSTEGLMVNRNGLIVGTLVGSADDSYAVYRLGALEHRFGTFPNTHVWTIADDDSFAGRTVISGEYVPTVWRC